MAAHPTRLALLPEPGETRPDFFATAREIVSGQEQRRAAEFAKRTGVRWSGMPYPEPPVVETVEAVVARLEREAAARAAYRLMLEGRFRRAAFLIYEATGDDRLLSCADRGLAANHDRAAALLAAAEGPAADAARAALADFMASRSKVAA